MSHQNIADVPPETPGIAGAIAAIEKRNGVGHSWQPIELAPKDRTEILAYGRGTDRPMWDTEKEMPFTCSVIRWDWCIIDTDEPAGEGLYRKVKKKALEGWRTDKSFFKPTHWMPLPQAPMEAK